MFALLTVSPRVACEQIDASLAREARRLLGDLIQTAFIITHDAEERRELLAGIRTLSPDLQGLWAEVLAACGIRADDWMVAPLACGCVPSTPSDLFVHLDSMESGLLNSCAVCGSSVSAWSEYVESSAYVTLTSLRQTTPIRGETRVSVFAQRLAPLILAVDELVIVDRYAGALAVRDSGATLQWFLEQIWRLKAIPVSIRTGTKGGVKHPYTHAAVSAACARAAAAARATTGTAESVGLATWNDSAFRRAAHDRFLGGVVGGRAIAITIGRGLQVFESAALTQRSTSGLTLNDDVIRDVTGQLGKPDGNIFRL